MAALSLVGAVVQSTLMAQKRGRTDSSVKEGGAGGGVKKEEDQEQSGEDPAGEGHGTKVHVNIVLVAWMDDTDQPHQASSACHSQEGLPLPGSDGPPHILARPTCHTQVEEFMSEY